MAKDDFIWTVEVNAQNKTVTLRNIQSIKNLKKFSDKM